MATRWFKRNGRRVAESRVRKAKDDYTLGKHWGTWRFALLSPSQRSRQNRPDDTPRVRIVVRAVHLAHVNHQQRPLLWALPIVHHHHSVTWRFVRWQPQRCPVPKRHLGFSLCP